MSAPEFFRPDYATYKIDPATLADHVRDFIAALESDDPGLATISDGWNRFRYIIAPDPGGSHWIIERSDLSDELKDRLQAVRKIVTDYGPHRFVEDKRQVLGMLSEILKSLQPQKNPNDPRDKFCYEAMKKGKALSAIKDAVNKKAKWESIYTDQGISQAARRFANRNQLPWPV